MHASQMKTIDKENTKLNILTTDDEFCMGDSGSGVVKKIANQYTCLVGIVTESINGQQCGQSTDGLVLVTPQMKRYINSYILN